MYDSGLRVGSIVTLKSGGQQMTVSALTLDNDVHCMWIGKGQLHERSFRKDVLTVVESSVDAYDFTTRRAAEPAGVGITAAACPQIERSVEEAALVQETAEPVTEQRPEYTEPAQEVRVSELEREAQPVPAAAATGWASPSPTGW